ncbi:FAD-dependent oxidoreductase [Desulfogranum mediterraneum]|uniref:FAD-dependent oxidoreductase n=1 Tax=Desulfogranum mediterraneum TaxID=160661 RepID=UPI0003FBD3EB|nr:FAD-dependent oxidoreductase [Desulfogranum mediterraneum]
MTRQKERLQRVIVIGATPEGIAATNKLGELGVPVTLIEAETDIDHKLSTEGYRLDSGLSFNAAHRPGLIRIMRNQAIRTILPASIRSIKHSPQGFSVRVRQEQTFIDPERCTLCGKCVANCPVITTEGCRPISFHARTSLPGRPFIDKRQQPLCQAGCPLGVNAQGYVALAAQGKFQEALALIRRHNVLPGICGRICTHPCEESCRRGELDEPVSIRAIKRFLADYALEHDLEPTPPARPDSSQEEEIAVIGSGPAGIAAAAELAGQGYPVSVFEKAPQAGGLLRYGIGDHRLPAEVLDRELAAIEELGVTFHTGRDVELTTELEPLQQRYQAVIIASGSWQDRALGVEGEELEGVEGCLAFLARCRHQSPEGELTAAAEVRGREVAVIGDGNAAFDLARILIRLGARVSLISWFKQEQIPADQEEIREALEEGLTIIDQTQVIAFNGQEGRLGTLQCRTTIPGTVDASGVAWPVIDQEQPAFHLSFDQALVAIGQVGGFARDGAPQGCRVTEQGLIATDEQQRAADSGIYAAGDAVSGPSSVVHAMASGKQAAAAVHADLRAEQLNTTASRPAERPFDPIPTEIPCRKRPEMAELQPAKRRNNFQEVALGLTQEQAQAEAGRCLQCGSCSECLECIASCGALGAIDHLQQPQEVIEQGGVLIVADPTMSTTVKGEDVIRAYGPKAARTASSDMIVRGYAAAARAMVLLGDGARKHLKGHGLAFSAPDAGLASEIRIGVFVCRCNDSLGWLEGMDRYLEQQQAADPAIVHVETLVSACVSEGTDAIIRATREKGLTRIVLGSCVCCPLNFVCSSCTDQRSRLKDRLFHGTGISRSMVETCNLRGEILRLIPANPALAQERFQGLLHRSIERTKILQPLPAVDRNYNFTAAVIGNSQATVNSALHLAETGHDVFHLDTSEQPLDAQLSHHNIHSLTGWEVQALSGTIGDFRILVQRDQEQQVLRAGTVILGEKVRRRLPYTHQEGLPNCCIEPMQQQKGKPNVPFAAPCATSVPGLFLAEPSGINVSKLKKGAAAAVMAAAALPRGPRQSKGFTVVIDQKKCRGCGRCTTVCPYHAVSFRQNQIDGWQATVDEAICKGCGNCISVCPTGAADSPYRNREYLEQALEELLSNSGVHE